MSDTHTYDGNVFTIANAAFFDGVNWAEGTAFSFDGNNWQPWFGEPIAPFIPPVSITCAEQRVCAVATASAGPCGTVTNCDSPGERHRVSWDHENCNNSKHHIAIHASENGGSFIEVGDNIDCNATEADTDCCTHLSPSCTPSGEWLRILARYTNPPGAGQTVDWTYKVRAEIDGTDTLVNAGASKTATGCTNCGGSGTGCIL